MLIPSVMTAVPGGNAMQSSPDPIAEDPRKAVVFGEVTIVHHAFAKPPVAEKIRCSMLQATLLANWSRCNRDKAHGTFSFPTCAVVHEKYC